MGHRGGRVGVAKHLGARACGAGSRGQEHKQKTNRATSWTKATVAMPYCQPQEESSAARPQALAHTWLMAGLPAAAASRRCGARRPPPSKSNTALPSRRSTVTARQMGVPSSIWSRVLTVPTCRHQCAAEHSASGPSVRQQCAVLAAGVSSKRQRLPEQLQLLPVGMHQPTSGRPWSSEKAVSISRTARSALACTQQWTSVVAAVLVPG